MSLLPTDPQAQPTAQATPPAEPSAPQEQAQESKPLTLADVERIATEKATRIAQSLVDKASHRLSQEAQQKIEALRLVQQDLNLSDEQVQQRVSKIVTDDLTTTRPTPQASESPAPVTDEGNPFLAAIQQVYEEEGTVIDANDPEYEKIMAAWNDPKGSMPKLVKATYDATAAKKARLQRIADNAAAATPGGAGGGAPTITAASAHDLWNTAYKK